MSGKFQFCFAEFFLRCCLIDFFFIWIRFKRKTSQNEMFFCLPNKRTADCQNAQVKLSQIQSDNITRGRGLHEMLLLFFPPGRLLKYNRKEERLFFMQSTWDRSDCLFRKIIDFELFDIEIISLDVKSKLVLWN